MALPLTSLRGEKPEKSAGGTASTETGRPSRRLLRVGLLISGLLALVYVASRRAGGPEIAEPAEPFEESVAGRSGEALPGEDRSREEIQERAEETVREEPTEPGEMTVEEDIVDEIVDEAEEDTAGGENDAVTASGEDEEESS